MTYTFKKATRSANNLVIGLSGGTGKGKTYTALRLAKGLARGGKIIAGDSEKGRISRYADEFEFDVAPINAPYRPQTYIDFLLEAFTLKPAVIIVDSATHEWVSEGGCLEWHDEIAKEMAKKWGGSPEKYNFQAWGDPKKEHWKLISKLEAAPCHIILTFRAKEKFEQLKVDGKTAIKSRGMCPDGSEDLPYSMDFIAMFEDKPGVPTFTYKPLTHTLTNIFKPGEQITERHGELLAAWGEGRKPTVGPTSGVTVEIPEQQGDMPRRTHGEANTGPNAPVPQTFKWEGGNGRTVKFDSAEQWHAYVLRGIGLAKSSEELRKSFDRNTHNMTEMLSNHTESYLKDVEEVYALRMAALNPINAG